MAWTSLMNACECIACDIYDVIESTTPFLSFLTGPKTSYPGAPCSRLHQPPPCHEGPRSKHLRLSWLSAAPNRIFFLDRCLFACSWQKAFTRRKRNPHPTAADPSPQQWGGERERENEGIRKKLECLLRQENWQTQTQETKKKQN